MEKDNVEAWNLYSLSLFPCQKIFKKKKKQTIEDKDSTETQKFIQQIINEENRTSYSLLYNLSCIIQWTLKSVTTMPIQENELIVLEAKEKEKLEKFIAILGKGTYGQVTRYSFFLEQIPLIIKKSNVFLGGSSSLLYEYLVCMHGINRLRLFSPHFVYTYAMFMEKETFQYQVLQEYINGETFHSFLWKLMQEKYSDEKMKLFLNVFLQIIFSLETAQHYIQFCHYDLHLKNIICQQISGEPKTIQYPLSNGIYEVQSCSHQMIILDYGMSSCSLSYSNKNNMTEPKRLSDLALYTTAKRFYIFPFFLAGIDISKFIYTIYAGHVQQFYKGNEYKNKKTMMGYFIGEFLQWMIQTFFEDKIFTRPDSNGKEATKKYLEFRYRYNFVPSLLYTPFMLIDFFEKNKRKFKEITGFDLKSLFTLKKYNHSNDIFNKIQEKQNFFSEDNKVHFEKRFCLPFQSLSPDLFSFENPSSLLYPMFFHHHLFLDSVTTSKFDLNDIKYFVTIKLDNIRVYFGNILHPLENVENTISQVIKLLQVEESHKINWSIFEDFFFSCWYCQCISSPDILIPFQKFYHQYFFTICYLWKVYLFCKTFLKSFSSYQGFPISAFFPDSRM